MKNILKISVVLSIFLSIFSCQKKTEYPIVPAITFKSLNKIARMDTSILGNIDSLELVLDFTDGDGDLGLPTENSKTDSTTLNTYFTLFKMKNNVWEEIKPVSPIEYFIPNLNSTGKAKALKGVIMIDVSIFPYFYFTTDTLRLNVFVKDNAGNKSNVVTSPNFFGFYK